MTGKRGAGLQACPRPYCLSGHLWNLVRRRLPDIGPALLAAGTAASAAGAGGV